MDAFPMYSEEEMNYADLSFRKTPIFRDAFVSLLIWHHLFYFCVYLECLAFFFI